jgi:Flp pilus assembly protein TadD
MTRLCAVAVFALLIISLAGCARYDAVRECQKEAGGMPTSNQWPNVVYAGGSLANSQTPEMQAFNKSVDDCMARYEAAQR